MPAGFNKCVRDKGRIRTVKGPNKKHGLKAGEYVKFCYINGKSYRGHKHKNKKSKKKSRRRK